MIKIIKNAIKCNFCGDIIESTHVHDFKYCSCGKVAVDGGHDYLENATHLGLPVPNKLKEILYQLHDKHKNKEEDNKNEQNNQ